MSDILVNALWTPDGTRLQSYSRHDYKEHVDSTNGKIYMVDGGLDYIRRSANGDEVDASVFLDDEYMLVREQVTWGTYGKNGDQPLRYIPVSEMSNDHIQAVLDTQTRIYPALREVLIMELEYRIENMIEVRD